MKTRGALVIIIATILILGGFFAYFYNKGSLQPQAAGTGAILSLSPSSGSQVVGSTFPVNIILNTNGQDTAGTDAILTYNTQDLDVLDANTTTAGTQIQPGTLYASYPGNSVDKVAGKISFSGIITPGATTGYNGTGTLATINFKVLRVAASSAVNFSFILNATNDSNVTSRTTFTDILDTVINGNFNLVPPDISATVNLTLQGRTNATTANTSLRIYNTGTSTLVYQKNDVATNSSGTAQFTISGVPGGNYDFKIKVNDYLIKALANVSLVSPLTLNFASLKAGDLNNDNIINSLDFSLMTGKWGLTDPDADINQDSTVNTIDFSLLNSNWFVVGQ